MSRPTNATRVEFHDTYQGTNAGDVIAVLAPESTGMGTLHIEMSAESASSMVKELVGNIASHGTAAQKRSLIVSLLDELDSDAEFAALFDSIRAEAVAV